MHVDLLDSAPKWEEGEEKWRNREVVISVNQVFPDESFKEQVLKRKAVLDERNVIYHPPPLVLLIRILVPHCLPTRRRLGVSISLMILFSSGRGGMMGSGIDVSICWLCWRAGAVEALPSTTEDVNVSIDDNHSSF